MRFWGLVLAVLCSVLTGAPAARAQAALDFGRYFALVIGNDGYRHLPKLKTAGNDARALADLLRARYGFQVELLLDADRDQLVAAVNSYRATLRDGDNFLIYYAGHGLIDEATDRGFWLPVDAAPGNEARWIDVALVSSNLRAMQARHVIVIADSCYAGSLVRASQDASLATGGARGLLLQRMRERRARMALTSGSLEPVIDSGGSGHSIFARALLGALRDNAEILSGSELFARVRARVVANARQTPLYADIRFTGHEGGDFIFVPRGASIELSVAAAPTVVRDALELAFWNAIKDSTIPDDYQAYLDAFPTGRFAPIARRRAELPSTPRQQGSSAATAPQRPNPTPSAPAQPAIADAAGLAQAWPAISLALRRQYDRSWAPLDRAYFLNEVKSYRVRSITADEITVTLDYMAQDLIGGANGFPRARQNEVRFRNRAPGFAILQWGAVPAETAIADAAQFTIHWKTIRDRLMAHYDRDFAVADGAFDIAAITGYEIAQFNASKILLKLDYVSNPIAAPADARSAMVRLANRSPTFPVLQWGDIVAGSDPAARGATKLSDIAEAQRFWPMLRRAVEHQYIAAIRFRPDESVSGAAETGPPAEMNIRRHEVTAVDAGQLVVAISYEVGGHGAPRRDRQATVRLRNDGPAFEIVEWQR